MKANSKFNTLKKRYSRIKNLKIKDSKNKKVIKTVEPSLYKTWEIVEYKKPYFKNPIIIEGMPGIGNVGKISMDVLIEQTKAELIMSFFSNQMPSSVFVTEDNLIALPEISLYYKRIKNKDFLFLTGDVQPITEQSSYEFSQLIVELFKKMNGEYIITLGGIGLNYIPEKPKVYLTGNDANFVSTVSMRMNKKNLKHERKIYGLIGPILGVSGLLLGVSMKNNVKAYSLLAETFGHPIFIGLDGAKAILHIINNYYALNINFDKLDNEIKRLEAQIKGLNIDDKESKDGLHKYSGYSDVNYIG